MARRAITFIVICWIAVLVYLIIRVR